MFQSDFGIIADYFVKRRKGYKTIENHKQIKHVDEMLKFMKIFAEDERFLQLDIKKDGKGEVTMCTILDNAINKGIEQGIERGITQGENLKLIMQVQKKMKKGDSITKIADDLVEDEIVISPNASFQVKTAGILKKALKEIHNLGGDYVSVLVNQNNE